MILLEWRRVREHVATCEYMTSATFFTSPDHPMAMRICSIVLWQSVTDSALWYVDCAWPSFKMLGPFTNPIAAMLAVEDQANEIDKMTGHLEAYAMLRDIEPILKADKTSATGQMTF